MISIIIPVYNVEAYLQHCIDSVLNQTYENFELILVDDGSYDKSSAICDGYACKDVRVRVIHQINYGVSAARNNGIIHAKGEWITFIDSDDWVDVDYLENFRFEESDSDLIVQGLKYYDNCNGQFFKYIRVNNCELCGPGQNELVAENKVLSLGYPVAKLFRRELIADKVFFNTNISYHEDHIFVLETYNLAKKIKLVDSVSYNYRYYHTGSSLSSQKHSWQNLNISSEGMLSAISDLKDRFLRQDSEYEKQIYTYAYTPKINAVFELFGLRGSNSEQNKHLKEIINKKELSCYYHPMDTKYILVKNVLLYFPFVFKKLFFIAYLKYQNRAK